VFFVLWERGFVMKIVINPIAKKVLIGFFALALLAIIFLSFHAAFLPRHVIPKAGSEPDVQTAIDSVTAFYTLDYTLSPELWISSVCAFSIEHGCNAVRSFFAPAIESQVRKYRIQTGCAVTPI
jgi:ABC-type antimicrobial peptide transport system permease subunit